MSKLKAAAKLMFLPLNLVNKIIPKKPDTMFFYSNLGFRDNVKSLYDYCIKKGLNSRFIITVATDEYEKYASSAPENVKFVSCTRGLLSFLRAKNCFYSFGKYPIKPAKKQIVVNLWHGMPLKNIGRLEKGHERDDQNYFTHLIATSPFYAEIMKKAFGAKDEQILITSQPRCDELFEKVDKPEFLKDFSKTIFWLPTFLSSKKLNKTDGHYDEINPFSVDLLEKVNAVAKKDNILLIVKPHPMDDVSVPRRDFSNILFINDNDIANKGYSLYSLLSFADALITDFSSVCLDFMLLDRPVAFSGAKRAEYSKNRGFVIEDISSLMAGENLECLEDLLEYIENFSQNKDTYKKMRQEVNDKVNTYKNGGCERILTTLKICTAEELK